ncbi:MAG: UDP-N-acetylmuramoyl-L-alanyl-D-glutamate--2,6-diaminopimelate ligase [Neolewinella sp.]|jgi:UDP-N-acetylmuramoyl-L-alanyl-D-glutamate--2,6-diaminopimelate ligase
MLLTQLLNRLQPLAVSGVVEKRWVSGVVFDSRKVVAGSLFVAVKGTQVDGHDYIEKAIALGAIVILGADAGAMERYISKVVLSPTPPQGGGASDDAIASLNQNSAPVIEGVTIDTASSELGAGVYTEDYWSVDIHESKAILDFAKQNRKNATPAEKLLWEALRANKIGHHFHRQKPMGRAIPDFVSLKRRVVVEVDGGYHASPAMLWTDAQRDKSFALVGYKTLRFTNEEVTNDIHSVVAQVKSTLDARADREVAYPTEIVYASSDNLGGNEPKARLSPLPPGEGPGERTTAAPIKSTLDARADREVAYPSEIVLTDTDNLGGNEPQARLAPLPTGEGRGERTTTFIQVADSALALALLSTEFYGNPSQDMTLVGITGTNGKTTVATLLHDLFSALGYKAGLLSTVEVRIGQEVIAATHTTPDAVAINATLADMRDAGCDYAFMEVSSHAVAQQRTRGLAFNGGVFTNLTHDHLDYHETFAAYRDAKKGFFDQLPKGAFALVNADDKNGDFMLQNTKASKLHYSLRKITNYRSKVLSNSPQGLQLELDGTEVFTRFIGRFNAYNLTAAFGVAMELGMERDEVLVALSSLTAAAGRLDYVGAPAGGITAVVDYAHTPDALKNVLTTLRDVMAPNARLLCVIGAGGDRDKTKRPKMARLAASLADQAILTSDNPRSEDPEAILNDMQAGLDEPELQAKTLRITDRRSAIRTAVQLAKGQDVVLVAGKGHETYQEIKGERFPFDDKLELANALKNRSYVG